MGQRDHLHRPRWGRCGLFGLLALLFTGRQGFLQKGIKRGPRKTMTGDLQEGAGQRLIGCVAHCGVVAPVFLLVVNGPQEAMGDIAFGAGLDQGVAFGLRDRGSSLQFADPPFKAGQHLFSFLADVGQLAIGEMGHVGHKHLAVVLEGQKCGSGALAAGVSAVVIGNNGATRRNRSRRRTSAGGALRFIERHSTKEM